MLKCLRGHRDSQPRWEKKPEQHGIEQRIVIRHDHDAAALERREISSHLHPEQQPQPRAEERAHYDRTPPGEAFDGGLRTLPSLSSSAQEARARGAVKGTYRSHQCEIVHDSVFRSYHYRLLLNTKK